MIHQFSSSGSSRDRSIERVDGELREKARTPIDLDPMNLRLAVGLGFEGVVFHGAKPSVEECLRETGFSHPRLWPPDITYLRCF